MCDNGTCGRLYNRYKRSRWWEQAKKRKLSLNVIDLFLKLEESEVPINKESNITESLDTYDDGYGYINLSDKFVYILFNTSRIVN